jgi:hypothetical protein
MRATFKHQTTLTQRKPMGTKMKQKASSRLLVAFHLTLTTANNLMVLSQQSLLLSSILPIHLLMPDRSLNRATWQLLTLKQQNLEILAIPRAHRLTPKPVLQVIQCSSFRYHSTTKVKLTLQVLPIRATVIILTTLRSAKV